MCCRNVLLFASHALNETLGGLEARQIVCSDGNSGVLGDVACRFGSTVLDDEATKTTKVNIVFLVQQAALNCLHKAFNHYGNVFLLNTSLYGYLGDNICLCQSYFCCYLFYIFLPISDMECKYTSFLCDKKIYLPFFTLHGVFLFVSKPAYSQRITLQGISEGYKKGRHINDASASILVIPAGFKPTTF